VNGHHTTCLSLHTSVAVACTQGRDIRGSNQCSAKRKNMQMFHIDLVGCAVRFYPQRKASDLCSKGFDLNSCPTVGQSFSICHTLSTIIQIAPSNGCLFYYFPQSVILIIFFISLTKPVNNFNGQNYSSEIVHPVKMYPDFFFFQKLKNCLLGAATGVACTELLHILF